MIPGPALDRLVERLDTWFARSEDDVLMYGRGRKSVVHLGDWLIDQFPYESALRERTAGDQRRRPVGPRSRPHHPDDPAPPPGLFLRQLHPLLCALTSAELVAYAEEPSGETPAIGSGKFRSMLIDIFGRSFPEKQFFMVDRDAVARYKARVHRNVVKVGERIDAVLRNVAVAAH